MFISIETICYNKMGINMAGEEKTVEFETYTRTTLGRPAVFYLPAEKLVGGVAMRIHDFLFKNFGGYTAEKGNISGCWENNERIEYNQHIRYTVAFLGKERIPDLEKFLSDIGREIGEKAIYLETGEDSWIIYPKMQGMQ